MVKLGCFVGGYVGLFVAVLMAADQHAAAAVVSLTAACLCGAGLYLLPGGNPMGKGERG